MDNNNNEKGWSSQAADPFGNTPPRKEPMLGGFDEDDPLEEPDRDTDYSTVYSEVDEAEELDAFEQEATGDDNLFATAAQDDGGEWDEDDLDEDYEEETAQPTWPLGMIMVAIFALVLLAAGGYGVMEQRSAMQEEIRQLQAALATSASPGEVASSREAVAATEQRNVELQQQVDSLTLTNRQLKDTAAGLEAQLQAQQAALQQASTPAAPKPAPAARPAPKPAPKPAPEPEPKPAASAPVVASTGWFVNFGSYSQQATAQSWSKRLQPSHGDVVVTMGSRDDRTYYRVRVVNLTNREQANAIARQLEKDYSMERLWVGKQ